MVSLIHNCSQAVLGLALLGVSVMACLRALPVFKVCLCLPFEIEACVYDCQTLSFLVCDEELQLSHSWCSNQCCEWRLMMHVLSHSRSHSSQWHLKLPHNLHEMTIIKAILRRRNNCLGDGWHNRADRAQSC